MSRWTPWGPAAAWAAVLFFLSTLPGVDHAPYLFSGEDKVAHFGLYAVLGAALVWGRHRADASPPAWFLVMMGIAYGASDEWHQSFVPGRDPSWGDWTADIAGVLLGYWAISVIFRRRASRAGAHPHIQNVPGPTPE